MKSSWKAWALACSWALLVLPTAASSQAALRPARAEQHQYIDGAGQPFLLDVYRNPSAEGARKPALLYFHGGGWRTGSRKQFRRQAAAITSRMDIVVISADYPINNDPVAATAAAQAALCWVRSNAQRLGIDPARIALAGGSAGGQLAVAAALADDSRVAACKAAPRHGVSALVLFSPVLEMKGRWEARMGRRLADVSPIDLVRTPLPPTIVFQGSDDIIAPLQDAQRFVDRARAVGSKHVDLRVYEARQHGFSGREDFDATVAETVDFLGRLGW